MNLNEKTENKRSLEDQDVLVSENNEQTISFKNEKQKEKKNKKKDKKKQSDKEIKQDVQDVDQEPMEDKLSEEYTDYKYSEDKSKKSNQSSNEKYELIENSDMTMIEKSEQESEYEQLPSSSTKQGHETILNKKLLKINAELERLQLKQERKRQELMEMMKLKESILAQQKMLKLEYEEWRLKQIQEHKEFKRRTKDEIKERKMQLKHEHEKWKQKEKELKKESKRKFKEEIKERKRNAKTVDSSSSDSDSVVSEESKFSGGRKTKSGRPRTDSVVNREQVKNFFVGIAHSMYRTLGIRKAWRYIKKRVIRKVFRKTYRFCVKKTRKAVHFITYLATNYYNIGLAIVFTALLTYVIFFKRAPVLEPN